LNKREITQTYGGEEKGGVALKNIVFVCTGNTCRSPMAQVMANDIFSTRGLLLRAHSCGVFAHVGSSASAHAVSAVREAYGLDLAGHVSQSASLELLEAAAVIICMTSSHKSHLFTQFAQFKAKTYTLLELAGEKGNITDPFGGNISIYNNCMLQIKKYLDKIEWGNYL